MKELKGEGVATLASAVPLGEGVPKMEDVEVKYMLPPEDRGTEGAISFCFQRLVEGAVREGGVRAESEIKVVGKGLESLTKGLDELKNGVSRTKLVIEV